MTGIGKKDVLSESLFDAFYISFRNYRLRIEKSIAYTKRVRIFSLSSRVFRVTLEGQTTFLK